MYRPYPDRDRALRHAERARASYLYGRFPQRYVLGFDADSAARAAAAMTKAAHPFGEMLRIIHADPPETPSFPLFARQA